jgi:hypothetical protein
MLEQILAVRLRDMGDDSAELLSAHGLLGLLGGQHQVGHLEGRAAPAGLVAAWT